MYLVVKDRKGLEELNVQSVLQVVEYIANLPTL